MISFSVIMPTYNQKGFIRNSIRSLFAQTYEHWELIIVDDGCTDGTKEFIDDYLQDSRVTYLRNAKNQGIGYAINRALDIAKYDYIAYLPSDDFYFKNHLQVMKDMFEKDADNILITTAIKSEISDSLLEHKNQLINGLPIGMCSQLVQTAHKKTLDRWTTRSEWVSEDLYLTFWQKLIGKGFFVNCNITTCQWTIHPLQRHKIMSETYGGHINRYRQYYMVKEPIKIKVSTRKYIDEEKIFRNFRSNTKTPQKGLKILIVGELSYNHERIYALEEAGHQLYGLWTQSPAYSFSNVGPLPFGHIKDLNPQKWEEEIKEIKPDIIYGLLNYCAIPIAHEVLTKRPDIPFVWHFKEGPFLCLEHEMWGKLVDLYTKSDGQIFLTKEVKSWYEQYIPQSKNFFILDGDLPKLDYFKNCFSPKISEKDGEIHTVVAGRMVGLSVEDIKTLAEHKIHIHLYNESYEASKNDIIKQAIRVAAGYFHVHNHCDAYDWTHELSKYDAGWLHLINSNNGGDLSKACWNDLNIPARLSAMMAAALPCIQKDNSGNIVAMQSILKEIDCGIFYKSIEDLSKQLHDKRRMEKLRMKVLEHRMDFSFDKHVPELMDFFKKTIENKKNHVQKTY